MLNERIPLFGVSVIVRAAALEDKVIVRAAALEEKIIGEILLLGLEFVRQQIQLV